MLFYIYIRLVVSVRCCTRACTAYVRLGAIADPCRSAPGNVVDWMYARAGVKYSYAAHLRDTGTVWLFSSYYRKALLKVHSYDPFLTKTVRVCAPAGMDQASRRRIS
jgi:hypothetical protein